MGGECGVVGCNVWGSECGGGVIVGLWVAMWGGGELGGECGVVGCSVQVGIVGCSVQVGGGGRGECGVVGCSVGVEGWGVIVGLWMQCGGGVGVSVGVGEVCLFSSGAVHVW